jgi:thrombospondin type 3 repeat protein
MIRVGAPLVAVITCLGTCLSACSFRGTAAGPGSGDAGPGSGDAGSGSGNDGNTGGGINDSDGDGVPDDIDNCVSVPNANQHDEDNDKVGDACDPCPQVANATADADGDGIPDACDPHPTAAGDVLVAFEPFTGTGNLPMGWQLRGGGQPADWKRGNDVMTIAADNATRIAIIDSGAPHHAIDIGVDVTSVRVAGSELQFLTGLTDARADVHQFFGCGMRFDSQPAGRCRELFVYDAAANPQFTGLQTDGSEPPTAPGSYRIVSVMNGQDESCVIPNGANQHRQADSENSRGNTFVGLRVNNVTASFRYVAIYKF